MRPKLLALIAVPAFALVGCASTELSAEPTVTVTVTAEPSTPTGPIEKQQPHQTKTDVEDLTRSELRDIAGSTFYFSVRALAPAAGDPATLDRNVYTDAFIDYCLDGKEIDVLKTEEATKQLTERAENITCPLFEQNLNSR